MGSTWERLSVRPGGTVAGLTVSSNELFAATGAGLFRSTDIGQSWTATTLGETVPLGETVAASNAVLLVGGNSGIYRSTDAGATWARTLVGGHVTSLAIAGSTALAGTELDGVFRSEDGGRSWVGANAGLHDLTVLALAVSPDFDRDGTALAATTSGLYRSRNAGKSWREIDLGAEVAVQCVQVSARFGNDRLALAGTEADGLLRSNDGGARWEPVEGLAGRSVTAIAFGPNGQIAVATDMGIGLSRDAGRTFHAEIPDPGQVLSLVFVADTLLAGLQRDGVARLDSEGWRTATHGLHARLVLGLALSPSYDKDHTVFVAAGADDGLLISRDEGRTWTAVLEDHTVVGVTAAPGQGLFAATASGVMRSGDGGHSWQRISADAPRIVVGGPPLLVATDTHTLIGSEDDGASWQTLATDHFNGAEIVSLAVAPDQTLFVGTKEAAVWRSVDVGRSWQRWLTDQVSADVLPLAALSADRVYVGLRAGVLTPIPATREVRHGEAMPLWRSVELAASVTGLAAAARVVFAATPAGVYVSHDAGEHFSLWTDGPTPIVGLALSPSFASDGQLYALGLGGAVWRRHEVA